MKLLVLSLLLVEYSEGSRILAFFPLAGKSHHYVFRPIMEGLGRRGHEVVYVTAYPYEGSVPPGVSQVDISKEIPEIKDNLDLLDMADDTVIESLTKLFDFSLFMAPHMVGCPTVQGLIHSDERFDAVLLESFFVQEYLSALIHKFGAVGIEIISLGDYAWMNELAGLPDNPSYQLDFKAELTQSMDFWQRLYNCYVSAVTTLGGYYYLHRMRGVMDQFFNYTGWEDRPPFGRLLSNRSLVLVNHHYIVGYPAPLPPHRKDIGGVCVRPNKPLPQRIQSFMDGAKAGVIYFSLGSHVTVSDPGNQKIIEVFMKVFEQLPQRVLMKWETDYPGKLPKNVQLEKWFPQQDVLAHKDCVLFITHGGYLSLTEAVHFGVPVVGIPFFGDQAKNFHFVEEAGIGKMLRLSNITYDSVSRTLVEVLTNPRYKEEMTRRSRILRDRPRDPVDEAVYWIEHAIKYPNVLTPKAADLSFVQLHLIDVKLFTLTVLFIAVVILWKLFVTVARMFKGKTKSSVHKQKRS